MASHRVVPETEEEGPEEMGNSMRSQMGHQGGHHPALSQPSRVNSFGEENQEGGLGDGMGEFYHRVHILRVLLFFLSPLTREVYSKQGNNNNNKIANSL